MTRSKDGKILFKVSDNKGVKTFVVAATVTDALEAWEAQERGEDAGTFRSVEILSDNSSIVIVDK